ncbi:MAG: malonyl CoA-acyl carrier protein transacylase [Epulopiscium sp. Nuni2H_MBin001]|nr:MAG: malonyl CoA-acyl carrier protein transacylase [Epulopiscium sp. Nuni2H_MBin001]
MGKSLYDNYEVSREIFDKANELLDWDVKEVCFTDVDQVINQTRYSQVAIFVTSIAAYKVALAQGITPQAFAGFSAGEYSALVASGMLSFEDGLKIIDHRAAFMTEATLVNPGIMRSVLGVDAKVVYDVCDDINKVLKKVDVVVANDNCPGQVTISGTEEAVEMATQVLKIGARRIIPLRVGGAFHSPMMDYAKDKLTTFIEPFEFKPPSIPIVSNVSADYMDNVKAKQFLPQQVATTVHFRQSLNRLIADGFDTFVEIGVKRTVVGFVRVIDSSLNTYHIDDMKSLTQTLEGLG